MDPATVPKVVLSKSPVQVHPPLVRLANGGCNKSSAPFGGGTGKESDPYLICSVSHLGAMTGSYSASHYLLTSDLDMTNEKHTCSGAIAGAFDGGGYVIKTFNANMYMGGKRTECYSASSARLTQ